MMYASSDYTVITRFLREIFKIPRENLRIIDPPPAQRFIIFSVFLNNNNNNNNINITREGTQAERAD
jgi:hypothetical protein